MRWPGIESIYGPTLRATTVYGPGGDGAGDKRWEDLHTRVIEHVSSSADPRFSKDTTHTYDIY